MGLPFKLGRFDCFTFVVGWVDECSSGGRGTVSARIRADVHYTTYREVRARYGDEFHWIAIASSFLGPSLNDVPRHGDVAVTVQDGRHMLGIVGTQLVYIPTDVGVAAIPVQYIVAHWRPFACLQ